MAGVRAVRDRIVAQIGFIIVVPGMRRGTEAYQNNAGTKGKPGTPQNEFRILGEFLNLTEEPLRECPVISHRVLASVARAGDNAVHLSALTCLGLERVRLHECG